jgi:UDP-glucose-4-epimerase GalE
MKKHILVTGGAGFIGSHTCKALAQAGYLPVTYDNLSRGHEAAVKWGPLAVHDLADPVALRRVILEHDIEAVIHFAAFAYVGESMEAPLSYFQNNVSNTLNLLQAMADTGVNTFVLSSTCATFGIPDTVPITEAHPQAPVNPYGDSKLMLERVLDWHGRDRDFHSVILRYFNAAGADPDGEIGEDHDPETHLVPLAIQAALGEIPYLEIFGDDYDTPDGTAVRDYIHVTDLADAHVRALEHLFEHGGQEAFNLGTGQGHSVRDILNAVERWRGHAVPARMGPRREGDPPRLVADPGRALAKLGWKPVLSDLDTIVRTAGDWQLRRFSRVETEVLETERVVA